MSEKSFAVASVSVAIIWGTFFYPPTRTAKQVDAPVAIAQDVSIDALRDDKGASRAPSPLLPLVAMSTARTTPKVQAAATAHECALTSAPGCAPLHKLAGD
ncbi:MAG: hypothetical protein V4631_20475 [Pseudomonadota bacterium]